MLNWTVKNYATSSTSKSMDRQTIVFHLPDELIEKIVDYTVKAGNVKICLDPFPLLPLTTLQNDKCLSIPTQSPPHQTNLANFCLLNRQWYRVAVTRLYARPWLYGTNYDLFVRTVCPGTTFGPVRRVQNRDLAEFVKELDLQLLVHQGSKSVTARLIGRTKTNLKIFRAPRSVFGVNCLAALSKCTQLRVLDLSAINSLVSYWDFARTLEKLPQLESLDAPRITTNNGPEHLHTIMSTRVPWPTTLSRLRLSSMYPSNDLAWIVQGPPPWVNPGLPNTLTVLVIQNGQFDRTILAKMLENAGPQLRDLTLTNLTKVGIFNDVLGYAQNLERLCISTNLINSLFPTFGTLDSCSQIHHPLQRLEIATCSGNIEVRADLSYFSIISLANTLHGGILTNLRRVDIWKSAVPRFRIDELECKLVHERLLALVAEEASGGEDAGLYTLDDNGWDGMVKLE